ncbi:hypothetical protein P4S72_25375 [Vibrio sp. PP-XX7]
MIRIAFGEPLTLRQQDIPLNGTAVELRINAEDPAKNFFPSPGIVQSLAWPTGTGCAWKAIYSPDTKFPPITIPYWRNWLFPESRGNRHLSGRYRPSMQPH